MIANDSILWDLPRRQRKLPAALPDWSNPECVRAWTFRPVPVVRSAEVDPVWSTDPVVVTRIYEWMVANGWGCEDALRRRASSPIV